jgi:deoxycytidylate deaminase
MMIIAPVGHARIAACVVYKNELISVGVCSYKTHPLQRRYGRNQHSVYLHAEVDAIIKAQKRVEARGISLKKCTLYVARVKRPAAFATSFIAGLAKPCEGCMKAIREAGIGKVVFTE